MENYHSHKPVLLKEIMQNLKVKDGETYVDCTFGAGGYSSAILNTANCNLYAFDRDENVKKFASETSIVICCVILS